MNTRLMNHGATAVGGVLGLDTIFDALDLLGEGGPLIKVAVLATKGLIMFGLGYFAFQPASIQTDGVAQVTPGPSGKLAWLLPCLLFMGCAGTADRIQKVNTVLVKIQADTNRALVTGCANLPAIEVALDVVQPFIPSAETSAAIEVGQVAAKDLCARVLAMQPAN